ncbi:MAG: aminoglycoside phosphotransferase family protein, partial [Pedobacter sp.]
MEKWILAKYGYSTTETKISAFGSGLINHTWKVVTKHGAFILQRINTNIFKNPEYIDHNLDLLKQYFNQNTPGYLFVAPLPTLTGDTYVLDKGDFYRFMPFVTGSHSVDFISNHGQAYQAAKQFGKFSALLKGFELSLLKDTLPDFHNLLLRSDQFLSALTNGNQQRVEEAAIEIHKIEQYKDIETQYRKI